LPCDAANVVSGWDALDFLDGKLDFVCDSFICSNFEVFPADTDAFFAEIVPQKVKVAAAITRMNSPNAELPRSEGAQK